MSDDVKQQDVEVVKAKKRNLEAQKQIFSALMSQWHLLGAVDVSIEFCLLKNGSWGILSARRLGGNAEDTTLKQALESDDEDDDVVGKKQTVVSVSKIDDAKIRSSYFG